MDREGVRKGPFEGDPAFMFFISHVFHLFHFLFFSCKNVPSIFFFLVFPSKMFHCWHQYQSVDVSSVVGAPPRCGVLTTQRVDSWDWVGPPTWERA